MDTQNLAEAGLFRVKVKIDGVERTVIMSKDSLALLGFQSVEEAEQSLVNMTSLRADFAAALDAKMDVMDYLDQVDAAYGELQGSALEQRLLELCAQCGEHAGAGSPAYASMCSERGAYSRGPARYDESVAQFQKAAEILAATVGEDSPDHTTVLSNLAGTYRLMGRHDEAERLCKLCLERYEKSLGREHVLYAAALNYYAMSCLDRGDTAQAATLLAQSSEILAALPEARDEYASSLCNRGALLYRLGRQDEAAGCLTEAIGLFEQELGTDTPHYHAAWNTLGLVRWKLGDLSAAADCFTIAAEKAEAMYGTEHPETRSAREALRRVREEQK